MSFRIARGAAASITAAAAAAMTAAAAAAVFFQRALVTDRFASASAACRGYNATTSCPIHPIANGGDEVHQTARSQETAIRDQRSESRGGRKEKTKRPLDEMATWWREKSNARNLTTEPSPDGPVKRRRRVLDGHLRRRSRAAKA